jgi:DNA-binding HxlR family transcriptional regulator/putative sterol carrier protein
MGVRSYKQFCPAARALDLVGERWTLLVVRELLSGPKRYTDLQDGLPGIGPNVLAERLRSLEAGGLVRKRRLPPPAASTVYELTELGLGLRPVVLGLFRWGLQLIDQPDGDETVRASYWLPAIQSAARPEMLPAQTNDVYEFRIGEEILTIRVQQGAIEVAAGPATAPDLVLSTDHQTFAGLGMGRISSPEAIADGLITVDGDPAAAQRCAALFGAAAEPTTVRG